MNDAKGTPLGDSQEFELLEELGRWVREQESTPDADLPLSPARQEALLEQIVGPAPEEPQAKRDASVRRRAGPLALVGYLLAAASLGAAFVSLRPQVEHEQGPQLAQRTGTTKPAFASLRIDGGSPRPDHLGSTAPGDRQPLCLGRPIRLALAVTKGRTMDSMGPLEVVLDAAPPWGPSMQFAYEVGRSDHFTWVDGGQALVFTGPLETLAPLPPGLWSLSVSAGAPGACRRPGDRSGCLSLPPRTLEVMGKDACDAPR